MFPEGRDRIWLGVILGGLEPGVSCCLQEGTDCLISVLFLQRDV